MKAQISLVPKDLHNVCILDIECGPAIHAKEYIKRGAKVYGIDISSKMIQLAKQECPAANFKVCSIYNPEYRR